MIKAITASTPGVAGFPGKTELRAGFPGLMMKSRDPESSTL